DLTIRTSLSISSWFCLFRLDTIVYFFFNDTATTEIYTTRHTLSLHDALPISSSSACGCWWSASGATSTYRSEEHTSELQSRLVISYAVFCLKKKKRQQILNLTTYTRFRQTTCRR